MIDHRINRAMNIDGTAREKAREAAAMVEQGLPIDEAERLVGVAYDPTVSTRRVGWIPTPADIAARTAAIRRQWTASDRNRRRTIQDAPPFEIPSIDTSDIGRG